MNIGIQARELNGSRGTAVYVENILRELIKLNKKHKIYIFHTGRAQKLPTSDSVECIKYRSINPVVDDHMTSQYLFNKYDIDIALFPKNVVPFLYSGQLVVTMHDLGYFRNWRFYDTLDTVYQRIMTRRSAEKSDIIIAVSKNTKRDICELLSVDKSKVKVIYHGIDQIFTQPVNQSDVSRFLETEGLGDSIIYGGATGKRKGNELIAEAFDQMEINEYQLVFTGDPESQFRERIKSNSSIHHLGYIDRENMPLLYSASRIFLYVSKYEGFGLPILEAQACGCPVIASKTTSISEVGANNVHYVDSYTVEELSNGIDKMLTDIEYRSLIIQKGEQNVKRFSWKRTAKQTLEILESLQ